MKQINLVSEQVANLVYATISELMGSELTYANMAEKCRRLAETDGLAEKLASQAILKSVKPETNGLKLLKALEKLLKETRAEVSKSVLEAEQKAQEEDKKFEEQTKMTKDDKKELAKIMRAIKRPTLKKMVIFTQPEYDWFIQQTLADKGISGNMARLPKCDFVTITTIIYPAIFHNNGFSLNRFAQILSLSALKSALKGCSPTYIDNLTSARWSILTISGTNKIPDDPTAQDVLDAAIDGILTVKQNPVLLSKLNAVYSNYVEALDYYHGLLYVNKRYAKAYLTTLDKAKELCAIAFGGLFKALKRKARYAVSGREQKESLDSLANVADLNSPIEKMFSASSSAQTLMIAGFVESEIRAIDDDTDRMICLLRAGGYTLSRIPAKIGGISKYRVEKVLKELKTKVNQLIEFDRILCECEAACEATLEYLHGSK